MTVDEFCKSINRKTGLEIVSNTVTTNQIRIIGRIPSQWVKPWLTIVEKLLITSETTPWKIDISKQYFIRGGKLIYGWRVILQSADPIENYLANIESVVSSIPTGAVGELEEVRLYGNVDYSVLQNGKGAQSVLTAVVGPEALRRRG